MEVLIPSTDDFEAETREAEKVQRVTLEKILKENAETEYLNKFGLNGKWDEETFRKCVPLAYHQDFEPYVQRIAEGDASPILAAKPFTTLSWSSGTTAGKPKLVAFNDALSRSFTRHSSICAAYASREFRVKEAMFLGFMYINPRHKSKGGLEVGSVSSNIYYSQSPEKKSDGMINIDHGKIDGGRICACSPKEISVASSYDQALYCHFLCALLHSDQIQFIRAAFCLQLVKAFRTFESIWKDLCADIREGVLVSPERVTDVKVRDSVSKLLAKLANPDLAESIYRKCEALQAKKWTGLIQELWPGVKYVSAILTGSMILYVDKLRHYAGDQVALVSWGYAASEGFIGINARPRSSNLESVAYAVYPSSAYFEFIPIIITKRQTQTPPLLSEEAELDEGLYDESEPVRLGDVRVGEIYEVVVTDFAGLYRYRMGDLVKVLGFYNSTPELQFLRRKNAILNIRMGKTTEIDLQLAVESATKLLSMEGGKAEIVDYTSYGDLSTEPGHYVIFWELINTGDDLPNMEVLQKCCNCMDFSFSDSAYVWERRKGHVGALELRILANGTFTKILEHCQTLGSSVNQFKTPRCIASSNTPVLKILEDSVVANCFSVAYD